MNSQCRLYNVFVTLIIVSLSILALYFFYKSKNIQPPPVGVTNLMERATQTFSLSPKGVIHIGAHTGEEAELYKAYNIKNVLWIEADPKLAENLRQKVAVDSCSKEIKVACFAASDKNGTGNFLITNNEGASSSLLKMKKHLEHSPNIHVIETIPVKLQKLDDYLEETQDSSPYNFLVADIQGGELSALKGAIKTLKHVDCIILEVSYVELYENWAPLQELDSFLNQQDFLRVDTTSVTAGYGDALYIRKKG